MPDEPSEKLAARVNITNVKTSAMKKDLNRQKNMMAAKKDLVKISVHPRMDPIWYSPTCRMHITTELEKLLGVLREEVHHHTYNGTGTDSHFRATSDPCEGDIRAVASHISHSVDIHHQTYQQVCSAEKAMEMQVNYNLHTQQLATYHLQLPISTLLL